MPLFNATATVFTMDEGPQIDAMLYRFQRAELGAAMRAFLKAALPRIPVRTGFLKFAFRPLRQQFTKDDGGGELNPILQTLFEEAGPKVTKARFEQAQSTTGFGTDKERPISAAGREARIRQMQREVRLSMKRHKKKRVAGRFMEYYYPGKGQRVPKSPPSNSLQFVTPKDAGDVLQLRGTTSEIKFDIAISYYRINDFYSRINGSPWRSLDAGMQAMLNYLEVSARRFPYITEVLVTSRIKLRGADVTVEANAPNQVADYRGRFGSAFYDSSGNIRGAKMDAYPTSATKKQLYNLDSGIKNYTDEST